MAQKTDVGSKDQRPKIAGNKYFILSPLKTFKLKEEIIDAIFQQTPPQLVQTVEECDVILVLCVIVSRTGTNIDAALNELNSLSESKPAVFVVLHHTFDPEKIVPDSSSYVSRENTLTVDCLFREDEGLLKCVRNQDAQARICQWLQPQDIQDIEEISTSNESDIIIASELMLVLLGKSVREKTAVERLILGRQESRCDPAPAPLKKMTVDTEEVDGEQVAVINTPDSWFNSSISIEEMKQKIHFCIDMSSRGPYALLLVIPVKQFCQMKSEILEIFKTKFYKRVMLLFTATNEQEEQEIKKDNLEELMNACGFDCFHVLNISQIGNRAQVSELLKKVEKIVKGDCKVCEMSKTRIEEIEEVITNRKQVSVGEMKNYIKVTLPNLTRTVWIAEEESSDISESYVML
ncbi:uncharacterized protein LOC122345143 [Puntigrus tetrazona]|uniref:uncharacterized protein LOC122345143 n=1 Tax=Puntigrus tetrazona TaxID=1606681 RepID=UPI001C8A5270|nr:uncharacterized protein LOC122345143 [Puntigrus tetrazona]